jgi:hypothetical protein
MTALCPGGLTTVNNDFLSDDWSVECTCGFVVQALSSNEAAVDTAEWHKGRPSHLGRVAGEAS